MQLAPARFRAILSCCAVALALFHSPDDARATGIRVLHNFCNGVSVFTADCSQGANPRTSLIADSDGNLYGTTFDRGLPGCNEDQGCGSVFKLAPDGTFSVLYRFTGGNDGGEPWGSLIRDAGGNLFGTTTAGGAHNVGVIYKLAPDGTETVLHDFGGASAAPWGSLLPDANGNLYGVARGGNGTVYKLAPDGTFTVLHTFCSNCSDGQNPNGDLVGDAQGNLYGTTQYGGSGGLIGAGTLFRIAPDGTETILWNFCSVGDCADGEFPMAGLIRDGAGNLYGTTDYGGNPVGEVFKFAPDGTLSVLYGFSDHGDGINPQTRLAMGADGSLYGTTLNSVFKLAPDGTFAALRYTGPQYEYRSTLIVDAHNNLFGTLPGGFTRGGNVYEIKQ
ncbi:MAG: hypothetical protein JO261_00820 [Alphaproteobacteria bacterium]|nr:hypothetical protein [Alphaproteobacteria bacterium]MBV9692218.1 hypothetical protein [Alphaproteobacteria bacterium]